MLFRNLYQQLFIFNFATQIWSVTFHNVYKIDRQLKLSENRYMFCNMLDWD